MLLYTYATQRPIGTRTRSLYVGTPAHVYTLPTTVSPPYARVGLYATVPARTGYTWAHPPTCAPYTAVRFLTSARAPVVILQDSRVPDVVVGKLKLTEGTMELEAGAPVTRHPRLSQDVIGSAARIALEDGALVTADALTPQTVVFVRTRDARVLIGDVGEAESASAANASGFPPPSQRQPASDPNLVAKLRSTLKELQAEIENLTRGAEDNQKRALSEATKIEKVREDKEKARKEEGNMAINRRVNEEVHRRLEAERQRQA